MMNANNAERDTFRGPCDLTCLPVEVVEMILSWLSTRELLNLRTTCSVWNKISKRLMRIRYVRLAGDWDQRSNGLEIFDIFHSHSLPWSGCSLGVELQQVFALRHPFFDTYGDKITSLEVTGFAATFNILEILRMVPNLENLYLPEAKEVVTRGLKNPENFKLEHLKSLFASLYVFNNSNVDYIKFLHGIAPSNLKLLEISNFALSQVEDVRRVAILFEKFPKVHLSVSIFFEQNMSAFDTVKLYIHHLNMRFSNIMAPLTHHFLSTLDHLKYLTMRIWIASPNSRLQLIKIPIMSTITHLSIDIGNWTCPDVLIGNIHEIALIVHFDIRSFPKLTKLTALSSFGSQEMDEIATMKFPTGVEAKYLRSGKLLLQEANGMEEDLPSVLDKFPVLTLSND